MGCCSSKDTAELIKFRNDCLAQHNEFRVMHGSPPLELNDKMCKDAQKWAQYIAKKKRVEYKPNSRFGQSIAAADARSTVAKKTVQDWYDEIEEFNFKKEKHTTRTKHFSQIVWKSTSRVGIGVKANGNKSYVVVFYDPPGNEEGQFMRNVLAVLLDKIASQKSLKGEFNKFERDALAEHNKLRAKHGCPPLTLSRKLCEVAKEWAINLADRNLIEHDPDCQYGENIFLTSGGTRGIDGRKAVKVWYEEEKNFIYGNGGFSELTGHFTQIVWKASTKLGVGVVKRGNSTWVVANYDPSGNYQGEYDTNVLPKEGQPNRVVRPRSASGGFSEFEVAGLEAHNQLRALHGCPPLRLKRELCAFSKEWAKSLASRDAFEHRKNNKYGENLYMAFGKTVTGATAVDSWYDEIKDYNFSKGGFSSATGHFTQVVWKNSTELGIAFETRGQKTYVVANYNPSGNVLGHFDENVPALVRRK